MCDVLEKKVEHCLSGRINNLVPLVGNPKNISRKQNVSKHLLPLASCTFLKITKHREKSN